MSFLRIKWWVNNQLHSVGAKLTLCCCGSCFIGDGRGLGSPPVTEARLTFLSLLQSGGNWQLQQGFSSRKGRRRHTTTVCSLTHGRGQAGLLALAVILEGRGYLCLSCCLVSVHQSSVQCILVFGKGMWSSEAGEVVPHLSQALQSCALVLPWTSSETWGGCAWFAWASEDPPF